jgi:hypothetical protein
MGKFKLNKILATCRFMIRELPEFLCEWSLSPSEHSQRKKRMNLVKKW